MFCRKNAKLLSYKTAYVFLAALLFLSLPLSAAGAAPLRLGAENQYPLAPHFEYLEDTKGELTVDALLNPSMSGRFQKIDGQNVNFGYSKSAYWLRALLRADPQKGEKLFLEIAYPSLDRTEVFLVAAGGSYQSFEAGDLQPFSSRPYPHRNFVFPLTFPPGGGATLLIRVKSAGSLTVPVTLWREEAFHNHSRNGYIVHSLYYGILGALFLYNLMLFLSLRDKVYLAYISFVACMAVGQMSLSGIGNEFLWSDFPAWGNIALPVGFSATGFFGALFTILFLDSRRNIPRLHFVIVALAAGFALSALSPAFTTYRFTAIFTSLLGVSFAATAVAAGVLCNVKGSHGARYFLLSWSLLLVGVAVLGMRNMGWLPTTFFTIYGMQIGSAIEMLLLSFALADRINQIRRDRDIAQKNALVLAADKENELAKKTKEWENTFNSISDMVVILDRNFRIVQANRAAAEFLKSASGSEMPENRKCHLIHHDSECPVENCPCLETFSTKQPATSEFFEPCMDKFIEVTTSPILNSEGDVTAAVHITKDISWRKNMEQELIKVQKLESIAGLAGGIAHDFNNMLTVIMSTATLAKMYAGGNPDVIAKLREAEDEIMQARGLANQLLTFSKGGAPVKKLLSFKELLRDTVAFSLKGSTVECEFEIADNLWAAEFDKVQLSQVISNLTINARQAMPHGGKLSVSADNITLGTRSEAPVSPGDYIKISFKDTGAGIPPKNLTKIFDPFFTTKAEGSGLGLSTSYSIVKKHNGYINVKSELGVGSVFDVYIPASAGFEVFKDGHVLIDMDGEGSVLIMDDDYNILKNVTEMLAVVGYDVVTARNGEEAVILYKRALALSRPFGAVVLDVTVVGGMGGKDCIKELHKIDPDVNAVVMSGYAEESVLAEYGKYGFKEALLKPFSIEELHEALNKVMQKRRAGDV